MESSSDNCNTNNAVEDDARFEVELEFVQCLSDVYYLKYLSDEGYFKDERFRAYILYLQYWRTHEYIKYIKYPYCLKILELLLDQDFVNILSSDLSIEALKYQIQNHWLCFNYEE